MNDDPGQLGQTLASDQAGRALERVLLESIPLGRIEKVKLPPVLHDPQRIIRRVHDPSLVAPKEELERAEQVLLQGDARREVPVQPDTGSHVAHDEDLEQLADGEVARARPHETCALGVQDVAVAEDRFDDLGRPGRGGVQGRDDQGHCGYGAALQAPVFRAEVPARRVASAQEHAQSLVEPLEARIQARTRLLGRTWPLRVLEQDRWFRTVGRCWAATTDFLFFSAHLIA